MNAAYTLPLLSCIAEPLCRRSAGRKVLHTPRQPAPLSVAGGGGRDEGRPGKIFDGLRRVEQRAC